MTFFVIVLVDAAIQALGFITAATLQTEIFFDLVGALTYVILTWVSWTLHGKSSKSLIASILVTLWAIRLGTFLFTRILRSGRDVRFEKIRGNPRRFLVVWIIQGIWVITTLAPVIVVNLKTDISASTFGTFEYAGILLWIFGFIIEAIADNQKKYFKSKKSNKDKFIDSGLWKISRHPNYFGEITLWTGMFIFCFPSLEGYEVLTVVSPVFVTWLLTKVSGIPYLERHADKKWGTNSAYLIYKRDTAILVPYII